MQEYLEQYKSDSNCIVDMQNAKYIQSENQQVLLPAIKHFDPYLLQFITTLNISGMGLQKVPVVIKECKCLQELNLRQNRLETIPTSFFVHYFPYLKILDLSDNYLTNLKQIVGLGIMQNLEVLNIQNNTIPKISSRIQLLESLLCQQKCPYQAEYKQGIKQNNYSVFLKMGTLDTILNNYQNNLALAVKAEEWCKSNPIEQIDEKKYCLNNLPVDSFSLSSGALYNPIESNGEVFVKGPGFMLYKDTRLQAPIVIIGKVKNAIIQKQALGKESHQMINANLNQYDNILQNITNNDLVSQYVQKFGFFGKLYFVYQHQYKPYQYLQSQKMKLTTTELLKRDTMRDPRIVTNIPLAKIQQLGIDMYNTMPSDIIRMVRKCYNMQDIEFINMCERDLLDLNKPFPRLRMLNGKIITVHELDKVYEYSRIKSEQHQMALNAAYLYCKTEIPRKLQIQCENNGLASTEQDEKVNTKQVQGIAGQDLKKKLIKITQSRPLSEVIRKQQIYNRLKEKQKEERKAALQDVNQFLTNGILKEEHDTTANLQKLLDAYDNDDTETIEQYLSMCQDVNDELLQAEIEMRKEEEIQKVKGIKFASSIMENALQSIKSKGPFLSPNRVEPLSKTQTPKEEEDPTSNVINVSGSIFKKAGKHQNLVLEDLNNSQDDSESETDHKTLQSLALLTPVVGGQRTATFRDTENAELQLYSMYEQQLNDKQAVNSDKPAIKSDEKQPYDNLKQSLMLTIQAEESYRITKEQSLANSNNNQKLKTLHDQCLISAPGMGNSLHIKADDAVISQSKINVSQSNPLKIVQSNLDTFEKVNKTNFKYAERSQIMKSQFVPNTDGLDLTNNTINYEELKNCEPEQQFIDISNLPTLQQPHAPSLSPDFQLIMQNEVRAQNEETSQLFAHVAKNIDKGVRQSLISPKSQFKMGKEMRHSSLLDIVMEGDKALGNPNSFKLNSKYTGKIGWKKYSEAQEILKSQQIPIPQAKILPRSPDRALQQTTEDIVDFLDTRIAQQHLNFERNRLGKVGETTDRDVIMKRLLRTNEEQIIKEQQKQLMKKHKANLELIRREPALHIRTSPTLALMAKEQRKLTYMREKICAERDKESQKTRNEQLKRQQLTDQATLQPIRIRNTGLAKLYKKEYVEPINIETIEEAAYDAAHWRVNPATLIYESARVMRNAREDIEDLENYAEQFIKRQSEYDALQSDPIRKLLQAPEPGDVRDMLGIGPENIGQQPRTQAYDPQSPLIKTLDARLDGKKADPTYEVRHTADIAVENAERLVKQLGNFENNIEDI